MDYGNIVLSYTYRGGRMNIGQLEYIVEVAKMKSLTKTSQSLHVTQSALSQSITQLETELDVRIFERTRTGAIPTEIGANIVKKADKILENLQELKEEAARHLIYSELRIGTIPGSSIFIPRIVSDYNDDYPNVSVVLTEESSQDIIDDIKQDKLDIGLIGLTREGEEMNDQTIGLDVILRGEMIVAASSHSSLAFVNSVNPQDIRKYPLVIYNDDRMWEFIDYFSDLFGDVQILFSTNDLDIIRDTVSEDLAITIGPDYTVNSDFSVLNGVIVSIPISELKQDYPGMALIHSKTKHISPYVYDFMTQLKLQLNQWESGIR